MQIDLAAAEPRPEPFRSQVCIIGAGIAGLTLARRLTQQGIDVALLEAGGFTLDTRSKQLVSAAQLTGTPHIGTHEGRFRTFGGASTHWGGQLLPFPVGPTNWPIHPSNLAPFYGDAEDFLAVDDLPYAATDFFTQAETPAPTLLDELPSLTARLSKWTPFSHRNLANTIGRNLLDDPNATIYFHAQATELVLSPTHNRIDAVLVRIRSGEIFHFEAKHFIVAAGAVETSRLLLASRSVASEGVGNTHDQVGRNFHDHLTIPAASITGPARTTLLAQIRPWIFDATLHTIKFEATPQLRRDLNLNPILAHFALEEPEDSGLAILRETLIARQRGNVLSALTANAGKLPRAAIEVLRMVLSAKRKHRRYVSSRTVLTLRLNAAQDARSNSRITLSDQLDPFGVPQPIVDWQISINEIETFRSFARHLRAQLKSVGLTEGLAWNPNLFTPNAPLKNIEDARHAMGGTCMGTDPQTSVVDTDLKVHGIDNLHIAGPSVFPDGSPQLPTLTMMALTLRLADSLSATF